MWAAFFRSSTLRLALLYMATFLLSMSVLLTFIYWSTAGYMARQADATIETEIQGLAEQYRQRGLNGLSTVMRERVARNPDGKSLYLFATADYQALAGNLSRWPDAKPDASGWVTFPVWGRVEEAPPEKPTHLGRARVFVLRGGLHLLVGRDIRELIEVRRLLVGAIGWGIALTTALAALGGLAISWSTSKRIEAINQTSREIMRGDLSQRVPTRGSGDDFDQLAENLNAMLDRIQELMAGVREVSDNVAHDLKTPLARLRNRLEALQRRSAEGARAGPAQRAREDPGSGARDVSCAEPGEGAVQAEQLAAGALAEADRLLSMFDAVLRIARIESGVRRVQMKPVELTRVLHDVFELYEPLAQESGLDLRLDVPVSITLPGDADLLFQAVSNLLDNAIKYSPPGGGVRLSGCLTRVQGGPEVQVVVADCGPGIPPAERERVFRRFHRLEGSRSTPGNGLGLSLVRAVVGLHDGTVELRSNAPAGLRAVLRFPLAAST